VTGALYVGPSGHSPTALRTWGRPSGVCAHGGTGHVPAMSGMPPERHPAQSWLMGSNTSQLTAHQNTTPTAMITNAATHSLTVSTHRGYDESLQRTHKPARKSSLAGPSGMIPPVAAGCGWGINEPRTPMRRWQGPRGTGGPRARHDTTLTPASPWTWDRPTCHSLATLAVAPWPSPAGRPPPAL
jgi:hypothetical protein